MWEAGGLTPARNTALVDHVFAGLGMANRPPVLAGHSTGPQGQADGLLDDAWLWDRT
jgi:hypothetical protein